MSKQFKLKTDTHIVIKREDVLTLLTAKEAEQLSKILKKIEDKRYAAGKKIYQSYYAVNKDEPYADKILEEIRKGEEAK